MKDKQSVSGEVVLKEYPRSTRWLKGQQVIGVGNLILTNERLIFLHQVALSPRQIENIQKLSESAQTNKIIDFALTLHKRNFQVPLSSVISAKMSRYCLLPFPRPYLRINYRGGSKDREKTLGFMFTIPIWKGWYQLEVTMVMSWVQMIKKALKAKQSSIGR
jgi:hypothetical protein